MPASSSVTIKPVADPGEKPLVVDGPFSETKEHFAGFYIVNCDTLEEAIEYGSSIATPDVFVEVRPVAWASGILAG